VDLAGELRQLFRLDFSGNRAIPSDDFRQHVSVEAARAKELVYETIRHRATSRKRIGVPYRFCQLIDPYLWLPATLGLAFRIGAP
jgi:hypothetical protein